MKTNFIFLVVLVALVTCFSTTSFAEKDPAAAARQAEIDADKAKAQIEQTERDARASIEVDGVDAPDLLAESEKVQELVKEELEASQAE